MLSEEQLVRIIRGPLGMNHIRGIADLYNVRQNTIEKRLLAAAVLDSRSRVWIYAKWLQTKLRSKDKTIDRKDTVERFCSLSSQWIREKDLLRRAWGDCIGSSMTEASSAERASLGTVSDYVDTEIRKWFRERKTNRAGCSSNRSNSVSGQGFSSRYHTPRTATPVTGCDSQRQRQTSQENNSWGPSHEGTRFNAVSVDDWSTYPEEWYQCPNCGEFGKHWHQNCPKVEHMKEATVTRSAASSGRSRCEDIGRNLGLLPDWANFPAPSYRCFSCGVVGDHYERKCPKLLEAKMESSHGPVGGHPEVPKDASPRPHSMLRPTTEISFTNLSPEPGEVLENASDSKSERLPLSSAMQPPHTPSLTYRLKRPFEPLETVNLDQPGAHQRGSHSSDGSTNPERKRVKFSGIEEQHPLYFVDTGRDRLQQQQTFHAESIRRRQSVIQMPDRDDRVECHPAIEAELDCAEVSQRPLAEHQKSWDTQSPLQPNGRMNCAINVPGGALDPIEASETSKMGVAPDIPIKTEQASLLQLGNPCNSCHGLGATCATSASSPSKVRSECLSHFATVDITARPSRSGQDSQAGPSNPRLEIEYDDMTQELNALEEADRFLAGLAVALEVMPKPAGQGLGFSQQVIGNCQNSGSRSTGSVNHHSGMELNSLPDTENQPAHGCEVKSSDEWVDCPFKVKAESPTPEMALSMGRSPNQRGKSVSVTAEYAAIRIKTESSSEESSSSESEVL